MDESHEREKLYKMAYENLERNKTQYTDSINKLKKKIEAYETKATEDHEIIQRLNQGLKLAHTRIDVFRDAQLQKNFAEKGATDPKIDVRFKLLFLSTIKKLNALFECPITLQPLVTPVVLPSGITIEKEAMHRLIKGQMLDPFNKEMQ